MKTNIIIVAIVAVLSTALVLVGAFVGWTFSNESAVVAQDHAVLGQIVNLIQKSQQAAQATQPAAVNK